ncbi:hypothetical protein SAMN04487936_103378 [Halobacillus dabanensis]|uniref:Uncharacterized protein n=1 Tax=Halobacillus dabanensis TaxID=240302 RepID=A0A1I3TKK6_HALDA|nr:hypothetical protein [Halobacillus dabanensis]SFJ70057.1 hypothetical protein SAMN04487936_103378 [Halobacillus dabanensis]
MQGIREMWLDQTGELGVIEREDQRFGSSFHPIKMEGKTKEILIINNLWYTTYTGARHFFRLHSNDYRVSGRMQRVDLMYLSDIR